MYYYLSGKPAILQPNLAVIDCGGVGYKCAISENTYKQIAKKETVLLYTYLNVKEDALDLYGFADEQEKQFFELLLSISGVGPKAALAILSVHTPETFAACVLSNDVKGITKAAGVGAKLAQRICLELKDKIAKTKVVPSEISSLGDFSVDTDAASEAVAVLVALGYSKNDASKAVLRCSADNTNDLVKQALRMLSRNL
ncbi:MAG: Holliday junction branch migration protein RuvA [Clostridia bacterium]|nr:Holliday junction branch migration protein RuvA [Clostridia bacterium]